MKKLLLFCMPVLLAISAFTPLNFPKKPSPEFAQQTAFNIDDWLIDDATAKRMEAFYRDCRNCPDKVNPKIKRKFVENPEVKKYLLQNYEIVSEEQRMGRYDEADEERYARARGIGRSEKKAKVKGWSTILKRYTVRSKIGFLTDKERVFITDEFTICPPPDSPPCD